MPPGGPADPVARSEWARRRRRAAAVHHPDRGGDTDSYLAALAAIDAAFGVTPGPLRAAGASGTPRPVHAEVTVQRTWRGVRMRLARRRRRLVRSVRTRLPRRVPGSRRTTQI